MRARFCLVRSRRARAALKVPVMSDALFEMPTPPPSLLKVIAVLEFPSVLVASSALAHPADDRRLVYEVVARYIFNAPTIWAYDTTYISRAPCSCWARLTRCAREVTSGLIFFWLAAAALAGGGRHRALRVRLFSRDSAVLPASLTFAGSPGCRARRFRKARGCRSSTRSRPSCR